MPQPQMQQMKVNFQTLLNRLPAKPSEPGSPIYEWEYLDENGEVQTDKMNVYEKIQSYSAQQDYKARIARGEEFKDEGALYMDVSQLGGDYASLDKYLGSLVADIQALVKEGALPSQVGENPAKSPETPLPSSEPATQEAGTGEGGKS